MLLLACVAALLQGSLCVVLDCLGLPVEYWLLPQVLNGVLGGFTIFSSSVFCAMADLSPAEQRSSHFVVPEVSVSVGASPDIWAWRLSCAHHPTD